MPLRKNILLLNPPGDRVYLRDYYCSSISKAGYYWHPIDLLISSGFFKNGYQVSVIDAIAGGYSIRDCMRRIISLNPNVIIFLTSTLSYEKDISFLRNVKNSCPDCSLIGSGEIFLDGSRTILAEYPFISACLRNFINGDIIKFIEGPIEEIQNMAYRDHDKICDKNVPTKNNDFILPLPRHELFPLEKYRMPFLYESPFASVLTNYGCPYPCSYCNSGTLGFARRDIENIIEELHYLSDMGIRVIYFRDMTFAADKKHAMRLCRRILEEKLYFKWFCFSRPDLMDQNIISVMKNAGCYLIHFGIETAQTDVLKKFNRNITHEMIQKAFALCRENGILPGGHYVIGFPGESESSIYRTIQLSKDLNGAYASFNIWSPRRGTQLHHPKKGIVETPLPERKISSLVRRAYRSYYLRPVYIIRELFMLRTRSQWKNFFRACFGIILRIISRSQE